MIFWRIKDNIVYNVADVKTLGFEADVIPDEYLKNEIFTVMRTCHGIGDWGIISAMPRLLKQKYPNCKVYLPSEKLLTNLLICCSVNSSSCSIKSFPLLVATPYSVIRPSVRISSKSWACNLL